MTSCDSRDVLASGEGRFNRFVLSSCVQTTPRWPLPSIFQVKVRRRGTHLVACGERWSSATRSSGLTCRSSGRTWGWWHTEVRQRALFSLLQSKPIVTGVFLSFSLPFRLETEWKLSCKVLKKDHFVQSCCSLKFSVPLIPVAILSLLFKFIAVYCDTAHCNTQVHQFFFTPLVSIYVVWLLISQCTLGNEYQKQALWEFEWTLKTFAVTHLVDKHECVSSTDWH